jgi:putative transferase (TIGR04331 family)
MKYNFLISVYRKAWIEGSKKIFLAEPFVYHALQKSGEHKNYEDIQIALPLWATKKELGKAHDFVDEKYHRYVVLLAERLNVLHERNNDVYFWKKRLSLGLVRYITFINQVFELCETYFRPEEHGCRIMSENSYHTPANFNDLREFFQYTAYGQEQIFSIYINLFYPGQFENFDDSFRQTKTGRCQSTINRLFRLTPRKILAKVYNFGNILKQYYLRANSGGPRIGIFGCFFTPKYLDELIIKSKGHIGTIPFDHYFKGNSPIDPDKRKRLTIADPDFDKFDRLFFTSLEYCLPKEFIEDFEEIETYFKSYFKNYPNLSHMVSEVWIGDTHTSRALAILQEKGVKHIYNEHNYLSHQFFGKNNTYIIPLVDTFVTLGWEDKRISNLIKGGSLFRWKEEKKYKKEHDLLFVDGLAMVKSPEFNAAYGDSGGARAQRFFDFNKRFFMSLDPETIKRMVFKQYPVMEWAISALEPFMVSYNYNTNGLKEYLDQTKKLNKEQSSKLLIAKSRLVIVSYLSTSYIEVLMADVPTIFFWNKDNYHLEEDYADFYDPLIAVGICQTDSVKAARFVEKTMNNPEEWWQSAPVRKAIETFLSRNIGSPRVMIDYLLNLAKAS